MTDTTLTFRIFVSSTFGDFKLERGELQKRVFKPLRELAAMHGCRFQPIDLRWGVSEEASLDQQAMSICLGEITHYRPIIPRYYVQATRKSRPWCRCWFFARIVIACTQTL